MHTRWRDTTLLYIHVFGIYNTARLTVLESLLDTQAGEFVPVLLHKPSDCLPRCPGIVAQGPANRLANEEFALMAPCQTEPEETILVRLLLQAVLGRVCTS